MLHSDPTKLFDPRPLDAAAPSRYRQAYARGYRGLRFERALEREFEHFQDAANLMRVRWAAYLALLLFGLFVLIDLATLPAHVARVTASIRAFGIMPAFAIGLVVSHHRAWHGHLQHAIALTSLIAGLGTVAVIAAALHAGYPFPTRASCLSRCTSTSSPAWAGGAHWR